MSGLAAPRRRYLWAVGERRIELGERTFLMGILNCTPDSFSDGGRHASVEDAVRHGLAMLDEGADALDLGAESTRPGAHAVSTETEHDRLLPVLRALRRARPDAVLSVDTYHAGTAAAALAAGADVINDVSGLMWDAAIAGTLSSALPRPGAVLMHTRGRPADWPGLPPLPAGEELSLVFSGLQETLAVASAAGIDMETVVLDPGFGFGKRGEENLALLLYLPALADLGRPVLAGLSRKGFLAAGEPARPLEPLPGRADGSWRLHATIAANTAALLGGAHLLRVHDVSAGRAAAAVADRLLTVAANATAADG